MPPSDVGAPLREGVWFNVGFGFGSLGCEDCDGRDSGGSGGLAVGGTLNQHVLLGVGTTGFVRSYDGELLSVGTLDGRVRIYPSRRSGFFLNGGLGLASDIIAQGSTPRPSNQSERERPMPDRLLDLLIPTSAVGCGLNAGVFFALSTVVMPALARLPPAQGIAAIALVPHSSQHRRGGLGRTFTVVTA